MKIKKNFIKIKIKYILVIIFIIFLAINLNPKMVHATNNIPVLGKIVKIISLKEYFKLSNSELDIDKPNIEYDEKLDKIINNDINNFADRIVDKFYKECDDNNHNFIKLSYNVLTNNDEWFTMKINVLEISASSNYYFKFYHIDKKKNKIVILDDLFNNDKYKDIILEDIKRQMILKMEEDEFADYYIDSGNEYLNRLNDNQNFYINKCGNIVIVYNKYEVGPGSIGVPEFEIDKKLYEKYLVK